MSKNNIRRCICDGEITMTLLGYACIQRVEWVVGCMGVRLLPTYTIIHPTTKDIGNWHITFPSPIWPHLN